MLEVSGNEGAYFQSVVSSLLTELDGVDSLPAAYEFQCHLAGAIRDSERSSTTEAKEDRYLLRLMGDALARKFLDYHILRELGRSETPPVSLTSQAEDFDFVLKVAKNMTEGGTLPIVADLTNLINVGDIVALSRRGIAIIECKNTTPSRYIGPSSARHRRQQKKAVNAANYFTSGHTTLEDETVLYSIDMHPYSPQYESIEKCIDLAERSDSGSAMVELSGRDLLLAVWDRGRGMDESMKSITSLLPASSAKQWELPVLSTTATALWESSPFTANVFELPLPARTRLAIMNGELTLIRFVDLGLLRAEWKSKRGEELKVELYQKGGGSHLRALVGSAPLELSDRFIEEILKNFCAAEEVRARLVWIVEYVSDRGAPSADPQPSPHVSSFHAFAYKDPNRPDKALFIAPMEQLSNMGIAVERDSLAVEGESGTGDDGEALVAIGVLESKPEGSTLRFSEPVATDDPLGYIKEALAKRHRSAEQQHRGD